MTRVSHTHRTVGYFRKACKPVKRAHPAMSWLESNVQIATREGPVQMWQLDARTSLEKKNSFYHIGSNNHIKSPWPPKSAQLLYMGLANSAW